jgi:uncharacterized membrane protein
MPDTSSAANTKTTSDIASIYQELESADRTAGVLEQRLETLEKRLDELLEKLEAEEEAGAAARSTEKETS